MTVGRLTSSLFLVSFFKNVRELKALSSSMEPTGNTAYICDTHTNSDMLSAMSGLAVIFCHIVLKVDDEVQPCADAHALEDAVDASCEEDKTCWQMPFLSVIRNLKATICSCNFLPSRGQGTS
jgi:hypothetical protein